MAPSLRMGKGGGASRETLDKMIGVSLLGLLLVLLLFQGGFFSESVAYVFAGFVFIVSATLVLAFRSIRKARTEKGTHASRFITVSTVSLVPAFSLAIIASLFALSALAHGLPLERLLDCTPWLLAALAALMACALERSGADWFLRGLAWFGVIGACIGVALASGVVFMGGTMQAGRLQFLFQYANAAGSWFACTSLLCFCSEDARLARSAVFPLAALLLTQSMGSIVIFACVVLMGMIARMARARCEGDDTHRIRCYADIASFLLQGALAAMAALCATYVFRDIPGAGFVLLIAVYCAFSFLWPRLASCFISIRRIRMLIGVTLAVCAATVFFLSFSLSDRILQAVGTFAERAIQANDASRLLLANLPLGIGPDQWQFVYQPLRSADYQAAVVHCGYLQMALDGGIAAPLVLIGLLALGSITAIRRRRPCIWLPLLFLGLHSFIDFDPRFAFFAVLIGIFAALAMSSKIEMYKT